MRGIRLYCNTPTHSQLEYIAQEANLEHGSIPLLKAPYLIARWKREKFLRMLMNGDQQETPEDLGVQISVPCASPSFCRALCESEK